MRIPKRFLSALVLLLAASLVACGDDGGTATKSTPGDSETEASEPDTSKAMSEEESSEAETSPFAEALNAAAAAPGKYAGLTMEMLVELDGDVVMRMTGKGSSDGTRSDMTLALPTGDMRMLFIDGVYYYQFPDLPGGVEWMSMAADEVTELSGIDPSANAGIDPASALELLTEVSEDVEEIGQDELHGVRVTGYRARVSRDAMLKRDIELGTFTGELGSDMRGVMPESFDMEIWIDDEGLPRRQAWTLDMDLGPEGRSSFYYQLDFKEWSTELDLEAPPADSVMSMDDLQSGAGMFGS